MYLVIGYRPSYTDTCMGCHMGTWDSLDFLDKAGTPQEVADMIAKEELCHRGDGYNGDGWNWLVIKPENIQDEDFYFGSGLEQTIIPEEVEALLSTTRDEWYLVQEEKDRQAEEQKKARLEKLKEEQELVQYEKLKAKFERKD